MERGMNGPEAKDLRTARSVPSGPGSNPPPGAVMGREERGGAMTQPIVVATDGSPAAAAAVTWAADDAVRKGLPLRIVHVLDRLPYDLPRYEIPDFEDRLSQAGRRILDEAAQAAREGRPGLEVTTELLFGDPAH